MPKQLPNFRKVKKQWLIYKNNIAKPEQLQPCIIPFKKFEEQPKFITEDKRGGGILVFTDELLQEFEDTLKNQIQNIVCNTTQFTQTEDKKKCEYCAYANMCNR